MTNGRTFGTSAALWCGSAAIAMLTGLATAQADELQLNQQALDARIDQLAAVGLQPGAGAVFSVDQNKAAGSPTLAGSFPRSILIPGTDTSIKIYGQITEILDYWMSGGGVAANTSPSNTTVDDNGFGQNTPLHNSIAAARGGGVFQQSPRESKIGFETRTPTPFGEARTVLEWDWTEAGSFVPGGSDPVSVSDNLAPRLRYAYATLGGLLAGQATSNFSDPDANGETLDFGGNFGEPGHVRVPQVRWTMPAWWGTSFSVSAEQPETVIATANGLEANDAGVIPTLTTSCSTGAPASASTPANSTCTTSLLTSGVTPLNIAKSTAPDFTAAWYIPQPWGHLDFSGVLRPAVHVADGKYFSKTFIGYGGHIGMSFRPGWMGWAKDTLSAHFTIGDTIGPFLNASTNFDLATNYGAPSTATSAGTYGGFNGPTSAASAAAILFKPTQEMGAELGYQHWWLDNLRSNISGGFNAHYGIPIKLVGAAQAGSINKELISAHANVIWNPVSFVDIALEYTWSQRTVLNNQTGTQNVLISKLAFRF